MSFDNKRIFLPLTKEKIELPLAILSLTFVKAKKLIHTAEGYSNGKNFALSTFARVKKIGSGFNFKVSIDFQAFAFHPSECKFNQNHTLRIMHKIATFCIF
jgi:hypothetical protein